jgi:hypothetical protein
MSVRRGGRRPAGLPPPHIVDRQHPLDVVIDTASTQRGGRGLGRAVGQCDHLHVCRVNRSPRRCDGRVWVQLGGPGDHIARRVRAGCGWWPIRERSPRSGRTVYDLVAAIRAFVDGWNDRREPFVWTKTAEEILAQRVPRRLCRRPRIGTAAPGRVVVRRRLALEFYRRYPTIPASLVLASAYAGWAGSLHPMPSNDDSGKPWN